MSVVSFQNPGRYGGLGLKGLRPLIDQLLDELVPEAESFVVRFVSDREMIALNRRFRELDKTTDVLSFPGEEGPEGHHLGDVVISVPTARRQAGVVGHTLEDELAVLVLHGLLHCMGYDHETDRGRMERLERRLRRKYLSG